MENLYNTTALVAAIDAMDRPGAFLRDTFFSERVYSPDEEIAIDKLLTRKTMAPFVSPDLPAKERAHRARQVTTFTPATLKPLNTVRPNDLIRRAHGEDIGGQLTPADRRENAVNQILNDHDDEITRREEWMCAHLLRSGEITVEGDDYVTQIVNYNRNADLTEVLVGGDRWGENGVSIKSFISSRATRVQKACGAAVRPVILGSGAAELFQNDEEIIRALDNQRQVSGSMELGPVASGISDKPEAYLGRLGQFEFWTFSQFFQDDEGNEVEIWPEFGVGMMAPAALRGMMAYGAILDMEALVSLERFPKNFTTDNPSREHILTQAAPLPVPSDVNGSFFSLVR